MRTIILMLLVLAVSLPDRARAQGGASMTREQYLQLKSRLEMARRVPVTIALVSGPSVARDGRILRRHGPHAGDVIVLHRDNADGARLATAIGDLLVAREMMGDTARRSATLRVASTGRRILADAEVQRAQRVVDRLLAAAPRAVPGVGNVPAVDVYLPSRGMRDAGRRKMHGDQKRASATRPPG